MKTFIKTFGIIIVAVMLAIASISLYTKDTKRKETREMLSESMEQVVTNLTKQDLTTANEAEMADYFVAKLTDRMTSVSALDVAIYDIDYNNGFVDAEVTAYFDYILGTGNVTVRKTMYIEEAKIVQNEKEVKGAEDEEDTLSLSHNMPVTVTSTADGSDTAYLVDNDADTIWSSKEAENGVNEEIVIDLGKVYSINRLRLTWGDKCPNSYTVQVSSDKDEWTDVYTKEDCSGGVDKVEIDKSICRYVKIICNDEAVNSIDIKEIEVFSSYDTTTEY